MFPPRPFTTLNCGCQCNKYLSTHPPDVAKTPGKCTPCMLGKVYGIACYTLTTCNPYVRVPQSEVLILNVPVNFQCTEVIDFFMPGHELIQEVVQHLIVVPATLKLCKATFIRRSSPIEFSMYSASKE